MSVHLAMSSILCLKVFDFAKEFDVRFSWGAGLESHTATGQGALVEGSVGLDQLDPGRRVKIISVDGSVQEVWILKVFFFEANHSDQLIATHVEFSDAPVHNKLYIIGDLDYSWMGCRRHYYMQIDKQPGHPHTKQCSLKA